MALSDYGNIEHRFLNAGLLSIGWTVMSIIVRIQQNKTISYTKLLNLEFLYVLCRHQLFPFLMKFYFQV
jgi:hypothetical protein